MKRLILPVVILAATVTLVVGVAVAASANQGPRTAEQLVPPTATAGGVPAYTAPEANAVWKTVRAKFAYHFPAGYSLPNYLNNKFSTTEKSQKVYVQPAYLDMQAARYWRCAELSNAFKSGSLTDGELSTLMDRYETLPSVKTFDQTGYTVRTLSAYATANSLPDAAHALFALDCQGVR